MVASNMRLSPSELKTKSLKDRLAIIMFAYEAERVFYKKAADKLRERQPKDHDKWDANDVSRIKDFNRNIEECINTLSVLEDLYKSEFDDYVAAERVVKIIGEEWAKVQLTDYHWIKEGE